MIHSLWQLMRPRARTIFVVILFVSFCTAASDIAAIALVSTFMAQAAGVSSRFVFPLTLTQMGLAAAAGLAFANLFGCLSSCVTARFASAQEYDISVRLLESHLRMPYTWFVDRHRAMLVGDVASGTISTRLFQPMLHMIRCIGSVAFIAMTLLWVDPLIAISATGFIAVCYTVLVLLTRPLVAHWGNEASKGGIATTKITLEAMDTLKAIRLLGREDEVLAAYDVQSARAARAAYRIRVIQNVPRFVLEVVAFGGIIALTLYLLSSGRGREVLPMLSLYAMAGYRLIPAIHDVYLSTTTLRYHRPLIARLKAALVPVPAPSQWGKAAVPLLPGRPEDAATQISPGWGEICVQDVRFSYKPGVSVLNGISLRIPRGSVIGIVGPSGTGKTTLLDLLLGLFEAESGTIEIGGVALKAANVSAWQRRIGYAPQDVVLVDETIRRNIALGLPPHRIDDDAVERAARVAGLSAHDFPEGYDTPVGERGVRLSGGQRQRISLARALYTDPDVLILDEATNNLDTMTETMVMDTVRSLRSEKTIIIVAHRFSLVRPCDCVYLLENGHIEARGTWDEMMSRSSTFASLAQGYA